MSTNYFSNHSQSRWMPLATSGSRDTGSSSPQSNASPSNSASHLPPSRVPSKHFSSSLHPNVDAKSGSLTKTNGSGPALHPLRHTWVFWFRQQHAPGAKVVDYEEGIKRISNFSSIESFWTLWAHLNPPSLLQPTTDYLLFHSAVRRPVWEDPLNIGGGKWIIRLRKGVADRLWEDLVLAVIGDQFDDGESDESGQPEICGCTISVRQSEDIISLWNKTGHDPKIANHTRDVLRKALNLPAATVIEYKSNNDSLNDKSSFRIHGNPDRERATPSTAER